MSHLPWLMKDSPFPPPTQALDDPNGLLAAGGDLSTNRLLSAYRQGIFPWFNDDQPILWWSPSPRCVIKPTELHISRSLNKFLNKGRFTVTVDTAFAQVINQCSSTRSAKGGTWITDDMIDAYIDLHTLGYAHSFEVWDNDQLVGGLYGIALGRCFFGESMFSIATNASKTAFVYLCKQLEQWHYQLIDCQVENDHLFTLGATTISRTKFLSILKENVNEPDRVGVWQLDWQW